MTVKSIIQKDTVKSPFEGGENLSSLPARALTQAGLFERDSRGMFLGLIILTIIVLLPTPSKAQESFEQTFTKTAQFTDPTGAKNKFHVLNINGSVTVEAYSGDTIKLTITEHIKGTNAEIQQAKEELVFKLEKRGNVILAYLDASFINIEYDEGKLGYDFKDEDRDYEFSYDLHAFVPRNILVDASTMNDGSVTVKGSFKKIKAHNLNGDVKLKHVTSKVAATTLNGDVNVIFEQQPPADSKFKTLNGNIDVTLPQQLSADIYFEGLRGDFYTSFKNFKRLDKKGERSNGLVKYTIGSFSPIRIGDGDIELRFEVLNGDVYLRKR